MFGRDAKQVGWGTPLKKRAATRTILTYARGPKAVNREFCGIV